MAAHAARERAARDATPLDCKRAYGRTGIVQVILTLAVRTCRTPGSWHRRHAIAWQIYRDLTRDFLPKCSCPLKYRDYEIRRSRGGYRLPLLPLRDIIVFPHMVVPLFVGRDKSLLGARRSDGRRQAAAARGAAPREDRRSERRRHLLDRHRRSHHPAAAVPEGPGEGPRRGSRARAHPRLRSRAIRSSCATSTMSKSPTRTRAEIAALMRSVQDVFEDYVKLNTRIPPEMLVSVRTIDEPGRLADTIVAHVALKLKDKQELLETPSPAKRLERLGELMQGEIEIRQVEKKLRTRVKKQMEKQQKEYYLNEQMQAIQKELGDRDEFKNELNELESKIKSKRMSKEAKDRCLKELKKLKQMSPMSRRGDGRAQLPRLGDRAAVGRQDRGPPRHQRGRERSSRPSTTASRRSRSASSSTSPCRRSCRASADRSCASSDRRASARRRSRARSRTRPAASSCASRSAACATKPRSAATAARTSARCPAS